MMARTISVNLDDYIIEGLRTFGKINDVVNKILECCMPNVDILTLPVAPPKNPNCHRVDIIVTNEQFLELNELYGEKNKNFSLKRLLYWFISNEMYNEYEGFTPTNENSKRIKYIAKLYDFSKFVERLKRSCYTTDSCDKLQEAIMQVIGELQ